MAHSVFEARVFFIIKINALESRSFPCISFRIVLLYKKWNSSTNDSYDYTNDKANLPLSEISNSR